MESNQKQQLEKWTNSEIGLKPLQVNQQIEIASKENKLMYVNDLRTEFAQLLAKIKVLLGLNSDMMPSGAELEIMLNYALDHWFTWSLKEIELAVVTNLNHQNQNYVECFGKISIKYLNDCLHEYKETKRRAILDNNRKKLMTQSNTAKEPDYIVNSKLFDGLVDFIQKQETPPTYWDWSRVYDHLEAQGLTNGYDKMAIYNQVKEEALKGLKTARANCQTVKELRDLESEDMEQQIRNSCKKFVVLDYVSKFVAEQKTENG